MSFRRKATSGRRQRDTGPTRWCPQCRAEYRPGFDICAECRLELVSERPPVAAAPSGVSFARNPAVDRLCPRCGAAPPFVSMGDSFGAGACLGCPECGLVVPDAPPMLAPSGDEVEYALGHWPVPDRAAITGALVQVGVPYRWERDLVLVVPAEVEDLVDGICDDLGADGTEGGDESGGVDDEVDGGEAARAAMVELYVAADRLRHAPGDGAGIDDLCRAAATVNASLPAYGVEGAAWRRLQTLASTVVADLESGLPAPLLVADAQALREFLRAYV